MLITKTAGHDVVNMQHPEHARHVFESLRNNRYAIIKNHSISLNELSHLYREWELFFAKNSAEKEKYLYSSETDDGYVPVNLEHAKDTEKADLKEFYQIHLDGLLMQKNVCSELSKKIFQELSELGEYLIQCIDGLLPKEIKSAMLMSFSSSVNGSKKHCMRFIHYPPCGEDEPYRSAPHDDICLLTIILPARGEGLMMKKNDGWNQEDAEDQSLVVFNSEMLEICTRGYFKSMTHQVITDLTGSASLASRYSMPFFLHPHANAFLSENLTSSAAVKQRIIETGLDKVGKTNG